MIPIRNCFIFLINLMIFNLCQKSVLSQEKIQVTKLECGSESQGDTYFDENFPESKVCRLKIGTTKKSYSEDLSKEYLLHCPANAQGSYSGSGSSQLGLEFQCYCSKHYLPTLDRKDCVSGKKLNESCTINEDKDYLERGGKTYTPTPGEMIQKYPDTCDQDSGFQCFNGKCACAKGKYNSEYEQCVSENYCKAINYYSTYDSINNTCIYPINREIYMYRNSPKFPCRPNSELTKLYEDSSVHSCKCISGFEMSEDENSCLHIISYNGKCNVTENDKDDQCSHNQGLQCIDGTCKCREKSQWDIREGKCRIPANEKCQPTSCSVTSTDSYCLRKPNLVCAKNSKCKEGYSQYCSCDEGYSSNSNKKFCYGNEFARCKEESDCGGELKCIDGICRCPGLLGQRFIYNKCRFLPGFNCPTLEPPKLKGFMSRIADKVVEKYGIVSSSGSSNNPCIDKAICQEGRCVCMNGTSATVHGECLLSFGNSCKYEQCNYDQGLACMDYKCSCIDPELEYLDGQGCLAPVDFPCGYDVGSSITCKETNCDNINNSKPKYVVQCKGPAKCTQLRNGFFKCV